MAVRAAARDTVRDPGGSALVVLAVATAAASAWMLLPLAFLVPGLLALALTAVDVRAEGRGPVGGREKTVATGEGV